MRVEFVGVGEAFDERVPNNSHIVGWKGGRMLVDCGYSVPYALWAMHPDADYLDAIYISHLHADHYFGLPAYLLRLAEEKRGRQVDVICGAGQKRRILELVEYAYSSLLPKFGFLLGFHEVLPDGELLYRGARMCFAPSTHPVDNLAICVTADDGRKYAYSGDGNFNEHTCRLYADCSLLVHESYALEDPIHGHASIADVIAMAAGQRVKRLALTHIQRDIRRNERERIQQLIDRSGLEVILPEPGDILQV